MASLTKARPRLRLQVPKVYLLFIGVWLAGLILGTYFAAVSGNYYFLLMHVAPTCPVSIVGLTATVLLPFLFTAYAVYKDRPWMLYGICFLKVFTFGFCGFGITAAYGSAGWLVRFLFQFSDICSVPILCWFALRNLNGRNANLKREFWICLGLNLIICCLDLCYISPFLAHITKN